jgi:hypothetical protein
LRPHWRHICDPVRLERCPFYRPRSGQLTGGRFSTARDRVDVMLQTHRSKRRRAAPTGTHRRIGGEKVGIVGSWNIALHVDMPALMATRSATIHWISDADPSRVLRVGRAHPNSNVPLPSRFESATVRWYCTIHRTICLAIVATAGPALNLKRLNAWES